jgi:hypothetical protein
VAPERTPLDKELLRAELKVYEVWVTVDREMAELLRRTPMFKDVGAGARCFKWSTHRVGPMKLFDIEVGTRFPTEYEIEQADNESLRCAQAMALKLIAAKGTRLVIITWSRRKPASGRYERGQALSGPVKGADGMPARFTKDRRTPVIDGEPTQKALDIDEGRL